MSVLFGAQAVLRTADGSATATVASADESFEPVPSRPE